MDNKLLLHRSKKRRLRAPLAMILFPSIASYNPAHSRALRRQSKAERGAAPAHPCLASTAPRAAPGSPRGTTTPPDSSVTGCRPRSAPMLKTRRQYGRPIPDRRKPPRGAPKGAAFPSPRGRACPRRGVQFTGRHFGAPPPRLAEGKHPPREAGDTRRPPAGPTEAAADFAWLFDK